MERRDTVDFLRPHMSTLQEILSEVRKNQRICPQPISWQQLYELLPDKRRKGAGWEPPAPLILAAWWESSNAEKAMRLREHIEWAAMHGALDQVGAFLLHLRESDWHHESQ